MNKKTITLQVKANGEVFTLGTEISNKSFVEDISQYKQAIQELLKAKEILQDTPVKPKPKPKTTRKPKTTEEK